MENNQEELGAEDLHVGNETTPNQQIEDETTPNQQVEDETTPVQQIEDETTPNQQIEDETTPDQQIEDETTPNQEIEDETSLNQEIRDETSADQHSGDETTSDQHSGHDTAYIQQIEDETAFNVPPISSNFEHTQTADRASVQPDVQVPLQSGGRKPSLLSNWSTRTSGSFRSKRRSHLLTQSQRSSLETIRPAEVMYYRRARVIQNPLVPPQPCHVQMRHGKLVPLRRMAIQPGPDRETLVQEKNHYREYMKRCSDSPTKAFDPNPAAITPFTARPNPHTRRVSKRVDDSFQIGWKKREERLKDYRDHVLAEELGYETLVGNLLYMDIPKGRDINRSWENFLSDDVMEWGFPYYKGSKERPRVKQREPYLAHQLKEKLWKYPKTRIFYSVAED